jgi:hypothetical protein
MTKQLLRFGHLAEIPAGGEGDGDLVEEVR